MANFDNKSIAELDKNEIAELAMWAAHAIADAYKETGVKLSAIDENFIGQFVNALIDDWQKGLTVDADQVLRRAMDFEDFKNGRVSDAALNVVVIFAEKFPKFVSLNSPSLKV